MALADGLADTAVNDRLGDRVTCWTLAEDRPPLFIGAKEGAFGSVEDTVAWVTAHRPVLDDLIASHGGVILRGFPIVASEDFGQVSGCFPAYTGGYQGGAAARRSVSKGVYEATQRTGDQRIPIHQEMFYLRDYPRRIAFFAKKVAEEGGETIIADMRGITGAMPAPLRAKLEKLGIRNIRNFAAKTGNNEENRHMDKRGWDFAFYTDSRDEVDEICKRRHMQPHWHEDGSLTVFNDETAFEIHPGTGERIYRGGIHLAHFFRGSYDNTGMAEKLREEQKYPSGAYLGDGSELDAEEEAEFGGVVDRFTYAWPWQDGDMMFLDNLATGHGRNPFSGTRATEVSLLD
jgi:alpha-ketoglutarate-dependent taurine dioxygenase